MHPNPIFRRASADQDIRFVRDRSFGMLIVDTGDVPLVSHIPFLMDTKASRAEAHLVRSNPIWAALQAPQKAKLVVTGPDGYVSPDWYGVPDQVPTWNYIAVHLTVTVHRLPQPDLRGILDRLSAHMERQIPGKKPWTIQKMTPEIYQKMERQIVPIGMEILDMTSTWKLSQNKPDQARLGAIDGLTHHGIGSDTLNLAHAMEKDIS